MELQSSANTIASAIPPKFLHPEFLSQDENNISVTKLWNYLPPGLKILILCSEEVVKLDGIIRFYWQQFPDVPCKLWHNPHSSLLLANYYARDSAMYKVAKSLVFNANFLIFANRCGWINDNNEVDKTRTITFRFAISVFSKRLHHYGECHPQLRLVGVVDFESRRLMEFTCQKEFPKLHEAYQVSKLNHSDTFEYTQKESKIDKHNTCLANETVNHMKSAFPESKSQSSNVRPNHENEKELCIVFVDDLSKDRCIIKIGDCTQLKWLFSDYAEERSASLRSFRFTYKGRTLFLSSVGKKTCKEMGWVSGSEVLVINLNAIEEEENTSNKASSSNQKKTTFPKSTKKRSNGKQKKKKKKQPIVIEKSEEDLKVEHSKQLGKIHEEAELVRFKDIRQRLNNLLLVRSKPKSKSVKKRCKSTSLDPLPLELMSSSSSEGLGGKAGKTHYNVLVGDVSNLYKTRKGSSSIQRQQRQLDLHGMRQEQALDALDKNLPAWYNTAMSGSYPFVVPVEIVCGGGAQILSEVVELWIKRNDQVANAPQARISHFARSA